MRPVFLVLGRRGFRRAAAGAAVILMEDHRQPIGRLDVVFQDHDLRGRRRLLRRRRRDRERSGQGSDERVVGRSCGSLSFAVV